MNELELDQLRQSFDRLRGRLFQALEAVGMPERQETAAKGVIRSITYDSQRAIEGAILDGRADTDDRNGRAGKAGRVPPPGRAAAQQRLAGRR